MSVVENAAIHANVTRAGRQRERRKKKREKKTGVRKGFIAVRVWFTFYFALDFKRGENRERER